MSVGTFGWWIGFLCGGQVMYYKDFLVAGSMHYRERGRLDHYFPPGWIGMSN